MWIQIPDVCVDHYTRGNIINRRQTMQIYCSRVEGGRKIAMILDVEDLDEFANQMEDWLDKSGIVTIFKLVRNNSDEYIDLDLLNADSELAIGEDGQCGIK